MIPTYEDGGLRLWHGPNMEILPAFADGSFDSIVTDPPYELGFMGKGWDSSGIAYDVDVWRECLRVLKPGGHLLAFGGSRTWHRMAVAIEDAGFEMRDSIAWLYGSGMPKSMNVAAAIDRKRDDEDAILAVSSRLAELAEAAGIPRRDIDAAMGTSDMAGWWLSRIRGRAAVASVENWTRLRALIPGAEELDAEVLRLNGRKGEAGEAWAAAEVLGVQIGAASGWNMDGSTKFVDRDIKAPNSDAAREWEGWGTALKPAFEPVVVARKPFRGTVAANVLAHGTGALNIDGARIEGRERTDYGLARAKRTRGGTFGAPTESADFDASKGRWPTNVLVDETQATALAEAARFFPTFRYEAKAPTSERPNVEGTVHATVKPLALIRWLVRLVTRPGGRVLDLYAGSGTTGEAALLEGMEVDLIELEEAHLPLILARVRKPLHPAMFGDWEDAS